jgi:nucleotide sugar dehydrogenase
VSVLILGSGVVGHATGVGLQKIGHDVVFVDVDEDRITALRDQNLTAAHPDETTLDGVESVFVCVPTPSTPDGIDLSYADHACKIIGSGLQTSSSDPLIVFRSTMPPGTTRQRLIPQLEEMSGRTHGRDLHVCYNPEYLRARSAVDDFLRFKLVTIGTADIGDAANQRMRQVFAHFGATFTDFTFEQAEFQKYVHNLFNATKISFFNEMRQAAEALGIEDAEATFRLTAATAESIWNPQYGMRNQGPFGGACLPKDTAAWVAHARKRNVPAQMIRAARAVNMAHQGWHA